MSIILTEEAKCDRRDRIVTPGFVQATEEVAARLENKTIVESLKTIHYGMLWEHAIHRQKTLNELEMHPLEKHYGCSQNIFQC